MGRYGMIVDLKRCVGCNACVVACKSEHNTPPGILQTTVLERETGQFPDANRIFVPVLVQSLSNTRSASRSARLGPPASGPTG